MKKLFLMGILVSASFMLANCGSSGGGGGDTVAVTPLCDSQFGCFSSAQAQSVCDANSSCYPVSGLVASDLSCQGSCSRRGDVMTKHGCEPSNNCGPCAAMDRHGQCRPAKEVSWHGRAGVPVVIGGQLMLQVPKLNSRGRSHPGVRHH